MIELFRGATVSYADASAVAKRRRSGIDMAPLHDGTIDGARHVARQLLNAAETVGFFYVCNHGLPRDLIARTDAVARQFFSLPQEQKQQVKVARWHRGYIRDRAKLKCMRARNLT